MDRRTSLAMMGNRHCEERSEDAIQAPIVMVGFTRLSGYDEKAGCNLIATAVPRCKKQHFPNMTSRLVSIKFTGKPRPTSSPLAKTSGLD
jgi:hypothetical protein